MQCTEQYVTSFNSPAEMQSLISSSVDDAYRSIWSQCIREEFAENGHADGGEVLSLTAYQTEGRTLRNANTLSWSEDYVKYKHSEKDLAWWTSTLHRLSYNSGPNLSACDTLMSGLRIVTGEVSSPTISVAALKDSLNVRGTTAHKYGIPSPSSSPTSSDIYLPGSSHACSERSSTTLSEKELSNGMGSDNEGTVSSDRDYCLSSRDSSRRIPTRSMALASRRAALALARSQSCTPSHFVPTHLLRRAHKVSSSATGQCSRPRAKQVDASTPFVVPEDFRCLHCDFVQSNHRVQDFKRHVASHFRSVIHWNCCGIPLAEAARHQVSRSGKIVEHSGMFFVGGCGRDFGRKDAYKRHLDDPNNRCMGDTDAAWHPGNAYKDLDW